MVIRSAFALLALTALSSAQQETNWKALGQEAYLFAYPLVLMDVTRQAAVDAPGFESNGFTHARAFPDDKFRQVVRPNADTLYSSVWLDLSKEPMLMRVPDTAGRYYLMQLMDAWTETISVPGKRTTGTGEGWFAITGPGWTGKLPANAKRIDCPTNMAWIIGRTQTNSATDYGNVHAIQAGYRIMPLSRYPDGVAKSARHDVANPERHKAPPPIVVANMSTAEFFQRFTQLLKSNPPHTGNEPMMAKIAKALDAISNPEFEAGVQQSKQLLATAETRRGAAATLGPTGWTKGSPFVGRYGTNYLARAFVARVGLGANPPEDAVYLNCNLDSKGATLDGAHRYKIHFDKSQLPPVNAFWSITVYDLAGYFTPNAIGRYAIGDRDALKYNDDGSLDLFVQSSAPEDSRNWLPSPKDPFNLSLRLYWPRAEILNGSWVPPAVAVVP